jgi:uncharacterized protein (DUF1778 family)
MRVVYVRVPDHIADLVESAADIENLSVNRFARWVLEKAAREIINASEQKKQEARSAADRFR